jgi:simple sugar transport system substrate-binding protein
LKTVQVFRDGTWKQSWDWDGPDWKDINNPDTSAVGFTFGKALSAENKTKVEAFIKGLADGSINLWKGPIVLQDGTVYVKEGATANRQRNLVLAAAVARDDRSKRANQVVA